MYLSILKKFKCNKQTSKNSIIFFIFFFIFISVSLKLSYNWYKFLNEPVVLPGQTIHYFFKQGDTLKSIANYFSNHGNLKQPNYLLWYAELKGFTHQLRAGEYYFKGPLYPTQLLDTIVKGQVVQHKITFIEGWTKKQIFQLLNQNKDIQHQLKNFTHSELLLRLDIKQNKLEGLFFPSTYNFIYGSSDIALLERAHALMKQQLIQMWKGRAKNLPYQSAYQALIVASLIEKETAIHAEQPLIASVIINRLNKHMLLQVDPTVIYALGVKYHGSLTTADLKVKNPYNTYINKGLPPTPICNPGKNAIYAALHPAVSDYLYYVAKGDGSHIFSETLQQHDQAINQYILKKQTVKISDEIKKS